MINKRAINEHIYDKISGFLHEPGHIIDVNYHIIQNGIINFANEEERDRFFVGVIDAHDQEIYSFTFGTVNGEYYGTRRNKSGVIEIIRNNEKTGGELWYYAVNEDWTLGERVFQAGRFDPRTREWYKAAVEAGGSTFSSVYNHFLMDDLSVSAAQPVFDQDGELRGVLGTHMLLSSIGTYLEDIIHDYQGYSVIVEKATGALIANSMGMDNFIIQDGTVNRYHIGDIENIINSESIGNLEIPQAYEQYIAHQDPEFLYQGKNVDQYINIKEINMGGLDWMIITGIS